MVALPDLQVDDIVGFPGRVVKGIQGSIDRTVSGSITHELESECFVHDKSCVHGVVTRLRTSKPLLVGLLMVSKPKATRPLRR